MEQTLVKLENALFIALKTERKTHEIHLHRRTN